MLEIQEKISQGHFGKVYNGSYNKKKCALKFIHIQSYCDEEIHIMNKLKNGKHIVTILYHGVIDEYAIIAMELLKKDLYNVVIEHKFLDETYAHQIFLQMLDGLNFMHNLRIVHRDLKLENCMLDFTDTIKWCDFGFARDMKDSTQSNRKCGSKSYCAPEILRGHTYNPFYSDVWSIGVCLFTMLEGYFPFEEASNFDYRYFQYKDDIKKISTYYTHKSQIGNPQLINLLNSLLCKTPEHRLSCQEIKKHSWII